MARARTDSPTDQDLMHQVLAEAEATPYDPTNETLIRSIAERQGLGEQGAPEPYVLPWHRASQPKPPHPTATPFLEAMESNFTKPLRAQLHNNKYVWGDPEMLPIAVGLVQYGIVLPSEVLPSYTYDSGAPLFPEPVLPRNKEQLMERARQDLRKRHSGGKA